ncbi:MAG: hypothetical protein JXA03_08130 [Bacteroidales bacterium]|nr:hypothetical protein [Bacteroidales bacterium]
MIPVILVGFIFNLRGQQDHVNLNFNPQKNYENLIPFAANVISPEVLDDKSVIFRVMAPEAENISLTGPVILLELKSDKPIPFTKGDDGLWTLKIGPLRQDIYFYFLEIDGVKVADPNNTFIGYANQPGYSLLVVPGDGPAYYDARDVPHGAVTRHIYHSEVLDGEREMYVYTPPDYDKNKTYPVLYLFGGSGELASTWNYFGRINFIVDNMLSEGKTIPMVIVMPNNQVIHRTTPGHREITHALFEKELINVIVPFVEMNYNVSKERHGRAVAGLSMGARHSQVVGFRNLNMFASFGLLSAGFESLDQTPAVFEPDFNSKVDYLFIGCGQYEPDSYGSVHVELEKLNIDFDYFKGGYGAHDFMTWRYLMYYHFLPKLWKTKN